MRGASKWIAVSILAALPVILAGQPAPRAVDDETVAALWNLVDRLIEGVRTDDEAAIDEAICLDEWLYARVERERALGLLDGNLSLSQLEERRDATRAGAILFTTRLLRRGEEVEWLDFSRLELSDQDAEGLASETGDEVAITGQGVLGVKMLTQPMPNDIEISRIGDRWCLNPFSMQ